MGEGIKSPADDLMHGESFCEVAIEDGKRVERPEEGLFELLLLVRDARSVVLLGTRSRCRDYRAHRDEP